jgi:hypothetical protein
MESKLETLPLRACLEMTEASALDFKSSFDPSSQQCWCEIIKDVVAMANTAGGVIVFGVNDDGTDVPVFSDLISAVDPAVLTDQFFRYTSCHFCDFSFVTVRRPSGEERPALEVRLAAYPLVFTAPGTYNVDPKRQKTAFGVGSLYFRHGAKSEPATPSDIRDAFDRFLNLARREWLSGIQKVVESPPGTRLVIGVAADVSAAPDTKPVRLTNDPGAPAISPEALAIQFPFRATEVVTQMRSKLGPSVHFTKHTLMAVRHAHGIDNQVGFSHRPPFGSRLFSPAFIDWLYNKYRENEEFLEHALASYADIRSQNRPK